MTDVTICTGLTEASANPEDSTDDQRIYHGYCIGRENQAATKHIVIANWGYHASKKTSIECYKSIVQLTTTKSLTFCRICNSKTCLTFDDIESAIRAFQILSEKSSITALGRKIRCAFSQVTYARLETMPRVAVTWSTYLRESLSTSGNGEGGKSDESSTSSGKSTSTGTSTLKDVADNVLPSIPCVPGLLLVLDAISIEEEKQLVNEIYAHGDVKNCKNKGGDGWSTCARKEARESKEFSFAAHRRVMHFGHRFDYDTRGVGRSATGGNLPPFLQKLALRIKRYCGQGINNEKPVTQDGGEEGGGEEGEDCFDQCTVNEYKAGHGISAHVDTHSVFGSILVSLSLLNQAVMSFVHSKNGQRLDLVLPPRSLLILKRDARYVWTHCIPPRSTDLMENGERMKRSTRLSVTLRRLRRPEEGPCKCKWPGVWCDSSQMLVEGNKSDSISPTSSPPTKKQKK
jgi:alkylated DNA repair dioxygenase AlkB